MKANDYTESLLPSSSNNYNNNYHKHIFTAHQDEEHQVLTMHSRSPLMQRIPSEESSITQQSTGIAISMSSGSIPTNTNVITALRQRAASTHHKPRVDNVFLYRSIPKFGDMFLDYKTSAIGLLHTGFAILTIILIIIGFKLNNDLSWKFGTFLCLITNIFGITHSMYSGSMHSQLGRLDAALQNFAVIIQKFAKALNIQEAYLWSMKNILDFVDHHILLIQYQHPEITEMRRMADTETDDGDIDYKKLSLIYHEFFERIKAQTVNQHKKWLLTFFGQYKLLDNRFGITKVEYLDFIRKLPNKSRTLFQSLTGIHKRFKQLNTSDELNQPPAKRHKKGKERRVIEGKEYEKEEEVVEMYTNQRKASIGVDIHGGYKTTSAIDEQLGDNAVLLYNDMTDLVYKVLEDIASMNKRLEHALAEKMLSFEREIEREKGKDNETDINEELNASFMLSKRMSVSLAHDAPNVTIAPNTKVLKQSNMAQGDDYLRIHNDEDDDEDYEYEAKSSTMIPTRSVSENQRIAPLLSKLQSYQGMSDIVKQRTLSVDDDWLKKVMTDLNDDDDTKHYDYSQSHVSYKL